MSVGLGLLLAGVVTLAPMVEARVGSGGSSGSRGSRSYSAPRAPVAPVTPSSPMSPARPTAPAPGPAMGGPRPGGLLGGLGGMLGGFVLGGLLGSLLFGGMGGLGAGIGLLDILVMAGLALLAFNLLRRRTPEPAVATAPAGAGSGYASGGGWAAPASATAPTETAAAGRPGTAADEDLAAGIEHVRAMDSSFDPARFLQVARDLFERLQIGWSGGDLAAVRAHLSDEMAAALDKDLTRLREQGRRNRIEQVRVESLALTEAWQEYGRDLVTVRIEATAIDYTVDARTEAVVEGSRTSPVRFEEYWTFVRPVGPNPWRLGAIQQPPA